MYSLKFMNEQKILKTQVIYIYIIFYDDSQTVKKIKIRNNKALPEEQSNFRIDHVKVWTDRGQAAFWISIKICH